MYVCMYVYVFKQQRGSVIHKTLFIHILAEKHKSMYLSIHPCVCLTLGGALFTTALPFLNSDLLNCCVCSALTWRFFGLARK